MAQLEPNGSSTIVVARFEFVYVGLRLWARLNQPRRGNYRGHEAHTPPRVVAPASTFRSHATSFLPLPLLHLPLLSLFRRPPCSSAPYAVLSSSPRSVFLTCSVLLSLGFRVSKF